MLKHETFYTRKIVKELSGILGGEFKRYEGVSTFTGCSDIIGYDQMGVFTAIEVKIEDRKLTKLQERFLREAPRAYIARVRENIKGKPYCVLRGMGDTFYIHAIHL